MAASTWLHTEPCKEYVSTLSSVSVGDDVAVALVVVEVDDCNRRVEAVGAQRGNRHGDVIVDAKAHPRFRLGMVKASADVEANAVFIANGPLRRFDRAADLPTLSDEDRVDVDELLFDAEDAAEVLWLCGSPEIRSRVCPAEVRQGDEGRGPNELRHHEPFGGQAPKDLFAARDLDARNARGLHEDVDLVLRVVPETDPVSESAPSLASLQPGGHGAQTEIEPLRKSVLAMCTLTTTGLPDAEIALASSRTESTLAGSSSKSPAAP